MTVDDRKASGADPAPARLGRGEVDYGVSGGVATVTLHRPPGNAWTPDLAGELVGLLERAARDGAVRAIVVTGAGADFCVGGDAEVLENLATHDFSPGRPAPWAPLTIAKPVIAAVNGASFGVGMQVALACDVRIGATSTKFATAFVRRGLIGELGITWLLPRIVGLGAANDLLLSGRLVRAPEAERLGLVSNVVPDGELLEAATGYATRLAATCSPAAMAVVKRQVYADLATTMLAATESADGYTRAAVSSDDFVEGVRSWRDGRAPRFGDLDPQRSRLPLPGDQHVQDDPRVWTGEVR